jgi:anti-sigma factor RsiW
MECREIQEMISAYVDSEVRPEEARRVEEHLGVCGECRAAEKRMRALGVAVARAEGDVPPGFRENLFSQMEKEDLLPKRRSIFVFSLRWAVVPLAAAAVLALYVLSFREAPRDPSFEAMRSPQVAVIEEELSPEDREIVANLEVLEDPDLFNETEAEIEEMEFFVPSARKRG